MRIVIIFMAMRQRLFKGHLEEGEEILQIVHKHWFMIIKGAIRVIIFGFCLPLIVWIVFPLTFLFWFMLLWMLLAVFRMTYTVFNWYLDAWLLTNMAIIDVQWDGFFKRSAQRMEYAAIEEVNYSFNGVFQTIFGYGTLTIQMAGGTTAIDNIERPKYVASQLSSLRDKILSTQKYKDEEVIKDILSGIIQRHIEKHGLQVKPDDK